MDEQAALHVEDLLEKADWIRSLARSLARDPDRAEDLAQSTIALALERRPAEGVPRHRWFAAVMRNLLRQDLRSARRRETREQRAARPETVPSEGELLERLEVQRRVVEAVRALEEPFRSTVLLRYFEGLSPAEIGERTGTPLRTVHSRLNRGHHLLRVRLDAEFGDRKAWLALLLPRSMTMGAGGSAMLLGTKVAIAAGVAGVVLATTWRIESGLEPRAPAKVSRGEESLDVRLAAMAIPPLAVPSDPGARTPIADQSTGAHAPIAIDCCKRDPNDTSVSTDTLEGRVVDLEGHPIEGAEVYSYVFDESFDAGVRTRRTFEMRARRGGSVTSRFSTTLTANFPRFGAASDPWTFGRSLRDERSNISFALSDLPPPIAISGPGGRFAIVAGGLRSGSVLHARTPYLVPVLQFDYDARDAGLGTPVLVLAETSTVAGIVVDEQGRPLAGLEVFVRVPESVRSTLGEITDRLEVLETFAHTDADGRFEIPHAPRVEGRHLYVTRDGSHTVGRSLSTEPETDLRIEFRIEPEITVPVRGIVVDDSGSPVAGARVGFGSPRFPAGPDGRFVLDANHAEAGNEIVATASGFVPARERFDPGMDEVRLRLGPRTQVLSGAVLDDEGNTMSGVEVCLADPTPSGSASVEFLATNGYAGPSTRATTDSAGRFEIGGLLDRSYSLFLVDRRTLRTSRAGPFLAGSRDVEIRFRSTDRSGRIAGRVVDPSGAPVPGAEVNLERPIVRSEGQKPDRTDVHATADATGAFEFPSVSLDVESIRVAFPRDVAYRRALTPGEDLEHLVLVAYRRAHFRIDLSASAIEADAFEILDGSGELLQILKYQGSLSMSWTTGAIEDGQSEVLAVAAAAQTLVLQRSGAEIARIQIHLVPGELTILRP